MKDDFKRKEGEKITFTPIFMEAVAKAIKDFPMINIALDGDKIIKRKNINLGIGRSFKNGDLIVPELKMILFSNLVGMSKAVNDLAGRAKKR